MSDRHTGARAWLARRPLLRALLIAWGAAALLTLWLAISASESFEHPLREVARTSAGIALGPFAGAFAREWEPCCLDNSLGWFRWAAAPLALGVAGALALRARAGEPSWRRRARLALWSLGWAAWFASGLASLLHALE